MPAEGSEQGASAEAGADDRYIVPALSRGLQALKACSTGRERLTLSEIAGAIGLSRSSAYRLVYTLDHLGFLSYDAGSRTYSLGAEVLRVTRPGATGLLMAEGGDIGILGRAELAADDPYEARKAYARAAALAPNRPEFLAG